MTKKTIVDLVLRDIGLYNDTKAREHANNKVRLAYENIWNAFDWRDAKSVLVLTGVGQVIRLPAWVENVQSASWDYSNKISQVNLGNMIEMSPQLGDTTLSSGTPLQYSILSPSSATYIQVGGGTEAKDIILASSSVSDVGVVVSIVGVDADGDEVRETVTLDGTSPVSSSNSYFDVWEISKPVTIGDISVLNGDSASLKTTLYANEHKKDHIRIMLFSEPSDSTKPLMLGVRRKFDGFWNDNDTIKIPAAEQAIIATLKADMLEYKQDYEKAAQKRNDANSFFMQATANERLLSAFDLRMGIEKPFSCSVGTRQRSGMFKI